MISPCTKPSSYNLSSDCEKFLIRNAFDKFLPEILPKEILWRTKEAFSDGVSKSTKSWFEVIQDYASEKLNIPNKKNAENIYYKQIAYEDAQNYYIRVAYRSLLLLMTIN